MLAVALVECVGSVCREKALNQSPTHEPSGLKRPGMSVGYCVARVSVGCVVACVDRGGGRRL